MRLSEITTEVYGYTITVFMILASCHYVLSETHNSIPTMHWRWTIKFALVFTHELTNSPKWLYHEISNFSFCVILMKLLHTITFLPLESNFNFSWDFTPSISNMSLKYYPNLLVQQTTLVSQVLHSVSLLCQDQELWTEAKATLISLIKRCLSTLLNKWLIVIQRETTQTL